MKFENISFIFENCEHITIDGKYIGQFLVDDINTRFQRASFNTVNRVDIADTFVIEIHKSANIEYTPLGADEFKSNTFDRFEKYSDITSINFSVDGVCYEFFVHWADGCDYSNDAQSVYISDCGNLYIVIHKEKSIDDFFDKDEINCKELMDLVFCVYDAEVSDDDKVISGQMSFDDMKGEILYTN